MVKAVVARAEQKLIVEPIEKDKGDHEAHDRNDTDDALASLRNFQLEKCAEIPPLPVSGGELFPQ